MLNPQQLEKIGLSGSSAQFYLAALELGEATVVEVAKRAGISRTLAYNTLARLCERGLLAQSQRNGRTVIIAAHPNTLVRKLDDDRRHLMDLMPELLSMYGGASVRPRIRFFEGQEGIINVLYDTLTCRSGTLRAMLSMLELLETPGRRAMEEYIKKRIATGLRLQVIRSRGEEVDNIWPTSSDDARELRYAEHDEPFAMTLYIYDAKVAMVSSRRENFGMIIESEEFSNLQTTLFSALWASSTAT